MQVNAGQDINASGSGIIGSNIQLQAGGNINGLVIGSRSVDINSAQNVDVTAFSGGDVNINAAAKFPARSSAAAMWTSAAIRSRRR